MEKMADEYANDSKCVENVSVANSEECSNQDTQREDPEDVLASFRQEWKRELETGSSLSNRSDSLGGSVSSSVAPSRATSVRSSPARTDPVLPNNGPATLDDIRPDVERQASELFNKGVALEQSGRLYEAIQFYRRAMTLVPDIEFRVHCRNNVERRDGHRGSLTDSTSIEGSSQENVEENDDDDDDDMADLISRFTRLTSGSAAVCDKKYEQDATHISCLPPEMLERIMCWLIGSDLDLQALEHIGKVCRGFYMVARNPELWHRACLRVWGIKCGPVGTYGSWRSMFIERPHPRYNGCYISCTTYFRVGENNFRDQNYQPWHVVRYYRYIRFFPEGKVLMLTCAEDPQVCINHLKNKEVRNQQVLQGNYRIHGSNVSLLFKISSRERMKNRKKIRGMHIGTTDVQETTFQLEFEIGNVKNNRNWQMSWRDYTIISVYQDDRQSVGKPSINDMNRFPPLKFSRVKSYILDNEEPLM